MGSIEAYDLPERAAGYDRDMAIMHPNRARMVEVVLEFLAQAGEEPRLAIDLGAGAGFVAERFLRRFPRSRIIAIDGAPSMTALAKTRLGRLAERVEFRIADFREISRIPELVPVDAIVSSFALHHLGLEDKRSVLASCAALLRPGGWFLNADLVVAESAEVERLIQRIRLEGIVGRAAGADDRFRDLSSTRRFLDDLEAREGDRPLTLSQDLALLKGAGFENVSLLWQEYREAVTAGRRPD